MKKLKNNFLAKEPKTHQIICTINGFTVELCKDRESLNTAFHLRYRAYLGTDAIDQNEEELLFDEFDFHPNSFVHLVWFEGKAVATVRGCIFSDEYDWCKTEGINYFPEDTAARFGNETRLLESNRFAVGPDFQGRQSLFAQLLLFRVHALNSYVHDCSHIITAVRANHIPFYRRFLGMEQVSTEAKSVTWADAEIILLATSVEDCLAAALKRNMPNFDLSEIRHYGKVADISTSVCTAPIAA